MKKFLAGTTALVAASVIAGHAQAADPIKLSVGGFMNTFVGYVDFEEITNGATPGANEDYADVLVSMDTELYFRGSTKLDNGLTVAVNIDVEADRDGDTGDDQDDVFLAVSSDTLGMVELGATKSPVYDMMVKAPSAGIGLSDSTAGDFANPTGYFSALTDDVKYGVAADGHKVNYFTPNLAGFQAAFSYGLIPTSANAAGGVDLSTAANDYQTGATLAYSGEIAGVSLSASAGHQRRENGGDGGQADDAEIISVYGAKVGFAGFEFGGGYNKVDDLGNLRGRDATIWDLGVSYATGPYAVSLGYVESKDDNTDSNSTDDDNFKEWVLGFGYDLGAGVELSAGIFSAENDGQSTAAQKREAWGAIAGLAVSF